MKIFARYARFQSDCFSISIVIPWVGQSISVVLCAHAIHFVRSDRLKVLTDSRYIHYTKSVSNVFTFIAQSYADYLCGKADVCDFGGAQHPKGKSREFFLSSSSFVKAMLNEIWKLYWMTRQRIHLVISKRMFRELKMSRCRVCMPLLSQK